jgi:hypothetical protein
LTLEPQNRVAESTIDSAISVITLAFSADPVARWAYPDPHVYYTYFPPFIRAFAGDAFEAGTAFLAGGIAGAALWLPPGVHPDEDAMNAIMQARIPEDRADVLGEFVAQQAETHPDYPHWYLPLIGLTPSSRDEASVRASCSVHWPNATAKGIPPTSSPPRNRAASCTSGMASRLSPRSGSRARRRCGPCCANRAEAAQSTSNLSTFSS